MFFYRTTDSVKSSQFAKSEQHALLVYVNNWNRGLQSFQAYTACTLYKQAVREAATICPAPCKLTFDLLTLKVVSESRVMWATSMPILIFLGLSDVRSRLRHDVRDKQTLDVRRASSLNAPYPRGGDIIIYTGYIHYLYKIIYKVDYMVIDWNSFSRLAHE